MQTNNSLRIRTKVNEDSYVSVKLDHNYETLEILSLKIDQKELYRYHVSDYGILVGRVLANNGFGVPNARLSLFIPKNETTSIVKELLYPYDNTLSKNEEGIRYNLLPDRQRDDCHQVVGTFPNKRVVLDDNTMLEIFSTYYKYTTRTNESGDYMFFGIPTGTYTLHMDLDISDCGKLSQRPRDFVYKGYTIEQFENANQFKVDTELSSLSQIFTQDVTVDVKPFWGDSNEKVQIGISRQDIDVAFKFEPTCVFMGSIVTDNQTVGISPKCIPSARMGEMSGLTTGQGRIEIIRKKIDNTIEELQIKGTQLIDGNGVWCFQIPMNLDYVMTDEYGNTVPTDNPEKGIPTRCEVRFRLSMDEESVDSLRYHRGKVLVPHNPQNEKEVDYHFGSRTMDSSFKSLMWNNVYTIKSFIPRFQKSSFPSSDKFTGIKKVNIHGSNNPMPYNNIRIEMPFMFWLVCVIVKLLVYFVSGINALKKGIMTVLGNLADITLTYSYISNELCPDLDNWYFAPEMKTTPLSANNNRTCRQWENQSVCETYKKIAADMSPESINGDVTYYSLISTNNTNANDEKHIFNNRTSETTVRICERNEWKDSEAYVLTETITEDEYKNLEFINTGIVKFYEDKNSEEGVISEETEVELSRYYLKDLYKEGGSSSYNLIDKNSIDSKNAVDKPDGVINLTTNTDYLMQCIEINLAQQYEVIKFDFYNDWINGCVYLPRWARDVKYKRRRKKGETIITEIPKMCINDVTKSRIARRYVQQCAVMYKDKENGGIKTDSNCGAKNRCHKKDKMTYISVLGSHSGVVNESITSRGDKVYYLKPCEFHDGDVVNFFATDIVMLGTLFDCNEYGLPSTFSSLVSTSYQMPPQLAETNVDDEASTYTNNVSAPTPREIKEWKCNSKCNKGGKMVTGKVNTNGVQKQLITSYPDLEAIVSGLSASDDKKVKYYRFSYNLKDDGNNTKDVKEIEAQNLFYSYRDDTTNEWSNIQCIIDETTKNEVAVFYDEDYKYYVTEENKEKVKLDAYSDTINQNDIKYYQVLIEEKITIITSLYRTVDENPESFVLEYEDLFPVTETAGVDWGYEGVGYTLSDGEKGEMHTKPSGHFLGLSCWNSETLPKSCVNLQRACEIGTSLSTRIDIPVNYNDEKVEYMYIAPNGFIGKDQITDATFRSAFATMNQNSLKTKLNAYGYKEYDFTYLLPDSFDGSYGRNESVYIKLKDEDDAYLGDFNNSELKKKIGDDVEISSGRTFIRDSEIQSKDYINFRFGGSPKFLNNRVPIFKNSFYFYFGLKDGSTALDEFRKQFYAPCAKNVIVEERGSLSVNVVKKTVYEAETIDMGEFIITPIISGLDYPFTYELHYLDKEGGFQIWEEDEWKSKKIDVLKRGKLISQENTIEVYPGNYELVVTDYKGNTISKTFNVGVDFFKCDYDLTSVTNFKEKFETNDSNWKKSRDKKKGEIGGYINGSFSTIGDMGDGYIDNNKGDGQKLIVPVIKKDEKDEKEVARYIYDKETNSFLWNRFFSSKKGQFCVWDDGTYEIWVRYYEKDDKNIKQPIYQYKLDEFVINNYEELIYSIGDRYILDSSVLKELNTKYGEWWEMSDTNSFKNVEDEKTNYFLYKNLVSGEDFNANKSFGIKVSGDVIGFKQEESTTGGLTNRYEVIEGGNISVQYLDGDINTPISRIPIYMVAYENLGDGEFKFSTLSLKNIKIENGYVVKKDEYEFETFKKYLNRFESDNIKDNYCLFKQTENDGKRLVKVRAVGNRIKVDPYENTNRPINGNGSLVILDQILPIRMEKRLDCLITVNNSSSAGIQRKIMPTSRCFNNKFDIPSLNFIFGSNGMYMKYTDSAEKTYMDEPQYNIVNIRLKNGYFLSNGVKFENGKFIPTYNGNVNILTNANLNTTNTSVEYLVVPKNISGDELFEDEVTRSMDNENISFRDDKDFIEKITFKKETDNKEKIVIINILR